VFCAPEIRVVGCCVGSGVCADPEMVRLLSQLLKKEAEWMQEHQDAFDAAKKSLASIS